MARKSPEYSAKKPFLEETKDVAWEAAKAFWKAHKASLDVAVKVRLSKILNLLPLDENSERKARENGRVGVEEAFIVPALEVMRTADEARQSGVEPAALVMEFLGEDKTRRYFDQAIALQYDEEKPLTNNERSLAGQLAASSVDLESDAISVVTESGNLINEMLGEAVGEKLIDVYEYRQLVSLIDRTGRVRMDMLSIDRNKYFWVAALMGLNNFDWFSPMFAKKIELYTNENGSVILKIGMEERMISPSLRGLVVGSMYQDNWEVMMAMAKGQFSFKRWQKLIRGISGYQREMDKFPDVGILQIGREGADRRTEIPVDRAERAVQRIMRFIKVIGRVNHRLDELETEDKNGNKRWLALNQMQLQEEVEELIGEQLPNIPRVKKVIEEAKLLRMNQMITKIDNNSRRVSSTNESEPKDSWKRFTEDNTIRKNSQLWFKMRFGKVGSAISRMLENDFEMLANNPDKIKMHLRGVRGVRENELEAGVKIVLAEARLRIRVNNDKLWLYQKYNIRADEWFATVDLKTLKALFRDNESEIGEQYRQGLEEYVQKRVSIFDYEKVMNLIWTVAEKWLTKREIEEKRRTVERTRVTQLVRRAVK